MHFPKARGRAASRSAERRRIGVASAALTAGLVLAGALVSADDLVQARIVEVHADTVKLGRGTEAGVREKQVYDIFGDSPNAYALPLTGGAAKLRVKQQLLARAIVISADRMTATAKVFDEKGKIDERSYAVLNKDASAPDQPPRVRGFSPQPNTPQASASWRGRVSLKLDIDIEPGRHAYYEWNTDGGAIVHGVEVAPGIFRTTVPENTWMAPYDRREVPGKPALAGYGVTVRALDSSGKFALQSFRVQSTGGQDAHSEAVHYKRTLSAKGILNVVRDVAFDRQDHAYVLDLKKGLVSDDLFVRELDADGHEVGAAQCPSKKYAAIAVSDTALFFLDLDDRTVKRWSRTADITQVFAANSTMIGEKGTGNGKLDNPVDLAYAPDGAILVLDQGQRCIQRYDSDGRFAYSFGKPGEGEHELKSPVAFAVNEDGVVYVLDDGRKKVVVYRNGRVEGTDIDVGVQGEDMKGVAVDNFTGAVHVLASGVKDEASGKKLDTIKHFARNGDPLPRSAGQGWNELAPLEKPSRMRIDGARILYIVDKEGKSLARFDGGNEGRGFPFLGRMGGVKMSKEIRLGVSPEGDVVALDKDAPCVIRFDQAGWATARFGGEASGAGQLKKPVGVAVDDEGNIFVADAKKVELDKFQWSGSLQWAKGGERVFQNIQDCQITSRRERVAVLQDRDDQTRLLALVTKDSGDVEAAVPAGAANDISSPYFATLAGRLEPDPSQKPAEDVGFWIADKKGSRLWRFKLGSNTPTQISHDFDKITAIAANIANVIFACDRGNKLIAPFGGGGATMPEIKDEQNCEKPLDLGVDDFGRLYVFDESNDGRIVVFGGD